MLQFASVTFITVIVCCLNEYVAPSTFDVNSANTSVWLSAATYCDTDSYMTRTYGGPSLGFIPTYVVDNQKQNTQGFVGYLPSAESVFVAYRGSSSPADWVNDMEGIFTDYLQCSDCKVHSGFYDAEQAVISEVTSAVADILDQFPTYKVVVTGHSLGAALSLLTALDLQSQLGVSVRLFNYGSPRVGNQQFSDYASSYLLDRNRITHHKDRVPHIPINENRYVHISGEWYEDVDSVVYECNGAEDTTCSDQWLYFQTNGVDHMYYLGLHMVCDAV